ncbi:unnamed protein product [Amaranthus hypochondriacus]
MSKRKSPNLLSFQSGIRLINEESAGLIARYLDNVYIQLRDLIAKPYNSAKHKIDSFYLTYQIVEDIRGVTAIKVDDDEIYSLEEMLAMVFQYGFVFVSANQFQGCGLYHCNLLGTFQLQYLSSKGSPAKFRFESRGGFYQLFCGHVYDSGIPREKRAGQALRVIDTIHRSSLYYISWLTCKKK